MKKYLFKRQSDGAWIYGDSPKSINSGGYRMEPSPSELTVTIYDRLNRDEPDVLENPITDFLKENGQPYANFEEFSDAVSGFFFRVSEFAGEAGILFPNPATGFKARVIIRDNKFCFDTELTATGFSGVVSADEGVTGDWVNKVEFPLY